jgi:hypothetical protein
MTGEFTDVLFVYTRDGSGHFWVFDRSLYHRFLWNAQGLWYIRSQTYLPEYSFGKCLLLDGDQRKALENESSRHHISLAFFENEAACNHFAVLVHQEQYVFDCTYPGGFFILA